MFFNLLLGFPLPKRTPSPMTLIMCRILRESWFAIAPRAQPAAGSGTKSAGVATIYLRIVFHVVLAPGELHFELHLTSFEPRHPSYSLLWDHKPRSRVVQFRYIKLIMFYGFRELDGFFDSEATALFRSLCCSPLQFGLLPFARVRLILRRSGRVDLRSLNPGSIYV